MFHNQCRLQSKHLPEWIVQRLHFCLVKNHQSACIEVHIDYKFCDWRMAKYTVQGDILLYNRPALYINTMCVCQIAVIPKS